MISKNRYKSSELVPMCKHVLAALLCSTAAKEAANDEDDGVAGKPIAAPTERTETEKEFTERLASTFSN